MNRLSAFNISIHAPHAGRDDWNVIRVKPHYDISIHAPHAGRDQCVVGQKNARRNFNPRAPCGARPPKGGTKVVTDRFQSTRPMRGATDRRPRTADRVSISIHAPHAGRDNLRMRSTVPNQHFNPRAPCGARRNSCILSKISHHFNPRAPCGARRTPISSIRRRESDFNPRAPCGARHHERPGARRTATFQSTRPMRGATTVTRIIKSL